VIEGLDWPRLHRALWQAISRYDGRLAATSREYADAIRVAVRAAEGRLSAEAEQYVVDYLDAAEAMVRDGLAAAVAPLGAAAQAAGADVLRDELIARTVQASYQRRWPDGLRLSDRVWSWSAEARARVSDALAEGLRLERSQGRILMDMQRSLEVRNGRFWAPGARDQAQSLATTSADWQPIRGWADDLADSARAYARTPEQRAGWNAVVREYQERLAKLRDGGTGRQARAFLADLERLVEGGRADLIDRRLDWFLYDKHQYKLRRIVRTEMANAQHGAVLEIGDADEDVTGYRWRRSAQPGSDPCQCELYATIDFGAGPGYWPRRRVPRSKPHPHCMCSVTPTSKPFPADADSRHPGVGGSGLPVTLA
jgi:hypothetical protein